MRCIIVDDDPLMVKILEQFVKKTPQLDYIRSCPNGLEAASLLKEEEVDLIFLDVEMPEMTGMELIESMSNPPQIVLITSKLEYAANAFNLDVADYIVKPPTYSRFLKAVNKAEELAANKSPVRTENGKLFIKVDSRLIAIKLEDISMVEAKADYVTIHAGDKRHTVYSTMKGIEAKLPSDRFIRVHRSFIVNKDQINSIEDNTLVIGKQLIPVGVTYRERLMATLNLL